MECNKNAIALITRIFTHTVPLTSIVIDGLITLQQSQSGNSWKQVWKCMGLDLKKPGAGSWKVY